MIRVACELGKYPDEIAEHMSMDQLLEFAAYLSLQNPREKSEDEMSVEDKLVKALGKPE